MAGRAHVEAFGGRWDGALVSGSNRQEFVWIGRGKVWKSSGPDRELYRRARDLNGAEVLLFAGNTWRVCECGVAHSRVGYDACPFCGALS